MSDETEITPTDLVLPVIGAFRVLVVDADADSAASLTALVRLWGLDARAARSGAAAVEAVAADRPRVVVLDPELPDADGCDLIRRIRASAVAPEVVVVTGETAPAWRRAVTAAGAAACLLKPSPPDELRGVVARLLGTQLGVVPPG
jgi:DNA-binding response OmpR family regulator